MYLKKLMIFLFSLSAGLIISCSSDDDSRDLPDDGTGGDTAGEEHLAVDYEFTFRGGDLDGETYAATIDPYDLQPMFKTNEASEQFDGDRIEFALQDTIGVKVVKVQMFIFLDEERNPLPLGEDISTESTMIVGIYEVGSAPETSYSSKSKTGSFSFIDLNIGEESAIPGVHPVTFHVDFDGNFRQLNSGTSINVDISGNINVYYTD